jgi:hypothetical protein
MNFLQFAQTFLNWIRLGAPIAGGKHRRTVPGGAPHRKALPKGPISSGKKPFALGFSKTRKGFCIIEGWEYYQKKSVYKAYSGAVRVSQFH